MLNVSAINAVGKFCISFSFILRKRKEKEENEKKREKKVTFHMFINVDIWKYEY